jgi:hypothetical protein
MINRYSMVLWRLVNHLLIVILTALLVNNFEISHLGEINNQYKLTTKL